MGLGGGQRLSLTHTHTLWENVVKGHFLVCVIVQFECPRGAELSEEDCVLNVCLFLSLSPSQPCSRCDGDLGVEVNGGVPSSPGSRGVPLPGLRPVPFPGPPSQTPQTVLVPSLTVT